MKLSRRFKKILGLICASIVLVPLSIGLLITLITAFFTIEGLIILATTVGLASLVIFGLILYQDNR